jgi:hypothetical protein
MVGRIPAGKLQMSTEDRLCQVISGNIIRREVDARSDRMQSLQLQSPRYGKVKEVSAPCQNKM